MSTGLLMSRSEVESHQRKHGFLGGGDNNGITMPQVSVPKSRMNGTETAYSLILEAMKRRGDIIEWRFEGISLAWGVDPRTGKPMYYTPDFWVLDGTISKESDLSATWNVMPPVEYTKVRLIEVKGAHIFAKDLIRFKGCRAEWPMFAFELHQKKGGEWNRIQ